eukprot:ANDGO_05553.mRNA.1 hypothetical protein
MGNRCATGPTARRAHDQELHGPQHVLPPSRGRNREGKKKAAVELPTSRPHNGSAHPLKQLTLRELHRPNALDLEGLDCEGPRLYDEEAWHTPGDGFDDVHGYGKCPSPAAAFHNNGSATTKVKPNFGENLLPPESLQSTPVPKRSPHEMELAAIDNHRTVSSLSSSVELTCTAGTDAASIDHDSSDNITPALKCPRATFHHIRAAGSTKYVVKDKFGRAPIPRQSTTLATDWTNDPFLKNDLQRGSMGSSSRTESSCATGTGTSNAAGTFNSQQKLSSDTVTSQSTATTASTTTTTVHAPSQQLGMHRHPTARLFKQSSSGGGGYGYHLRSSSVGLPTMSVRSSLVVLPSSFRSVEQSKNPQLSATVGNFSDPLPMSSSSSNYFRELQESKTRTLSMDWDAKALISEPTAAATRQQQKPASRRSSRMSVGSTTTISDSSTTRQAEDHAEAVHPVPSAVFSDRTSMERSKSSRFPESEHEFGFTIANKTMFPVRVNILVQRAAGPHLENFEFIVLPFMTPGFELVACTVPGSKILALLVSQGWQRVSCTKADTWDRARKASCYEFAVSVRSCPAVTSSTSAAVGVSQATEPPKIRIRLYSACKSFRKKLFEGVSDRHAESDYSIPYNAFDNDSVSALLNHNTFQVLNQPQ